MRPTAKHATEGQWLSAEGNSKITIAPCGDKLCGKLTWIKDPKKALKNGPLGTVICKDFSITDKTTLEGGKIYDPRNDKWYTGRIKIGNDGKLELRGWLGIPAMGKSVYWTRAD